LAKQKDLNRINTTN